MYIALRTGGGRGVYEIAGATATGIASSDLLHREIVLEFSPDLRIPTGVVLDVQGGKNRLRIASAEIQIQRQLAAALMLPSPRRVNDANPSLQLPTSKAYVVDRIDLEFANHLLPNVAYVVPGRIELKTVSDEKKIEAQQRLAVLQSVWGHCSQLPEPIQSLVKRHQELVSEGVSIGKDCEQIVASIQQEANSLWPHVAQKGGDPLQALAITLELEFGMPESIVDDTPGGGFDPGGIEGVPKRTYRAIIERRGQPSFRKGLLEAYGQKCQITQSTGEPALEAAHIFPYSEGGEYTNDLRNGLLLRADIHALFDLGLIGVTPHTLVIRVKDSLSGTTYEVLDGTVLQTSAALQPSHEALEKKWSKLWSQDD